MTKEKDININLEIEGWFTFTKLYDYVVDRFPDGSTFVELGCFAGKSTAYLASKIQKSKKNIKLICVDTWKGSPERKDIASQMLHNYNGDIFPTFKSNLEKLSLFDFIIPLQGKSVDAAKLFPPQQIDFIFIDAAHDYQSVTEDVVSWKPKMKDNGIMAGHDFSFPGVNKTVREQFEDFERFPGNCWIVHLEKSPKKRNLIL